ncbi:hypothetical protein [Parasitella parasitica]|uniref:Uncharacterized protein n=1 Tax=Parasitella parasitica TaxID=35722 RepID=A0A0B7NFR2_9FUNG|nr:hypothetical protein [Parasitella parasitica]
MSKLILNKDDVINIVVSAITGDNASNKYSTKPTEWPDFKRSDVLYCPSSRKDLKCHPPLLIEIQYSADMNFFRRLVDYSLSIKKCYDTLPIALAVVVHNTSQELSNITSECQKFPFAKKLPCTGWAKDCLLIYKQTVSDHLENKPLEPLVALAHFLIEGKSALINMEKGNDETIKNLYTIAKQMVSHEFINEKISTTAFEELYCYAINGLNQTEEILLEYLLEALSPKKKKC